MKILFRDGTIIETDKNINIGDIIEYDGVRYGIDGLSAAVIRNDYIQENENLGQEKDTCDVCECPYCGYFVDHDNEDINHGFTCPHCGMRYTAEVYQQTVYRTIPQSSFFKIKKQWGKENRE